MPFDKSEFRGDPSIGMYVAASEDFAIVPPNVQDSLVEVLEGSLEVEVVRGSVGGSKLMGALCSMNSSGVAVTRMASDGDLGPLEDAGMEVAVVDTPLTASGNVVLANDSAALVHPELGSEAVGEVEEILDVNVERGSVGPYKTVGSAAVVTNDGMLLPGTVTEGQRRELEEVFGVPAATGSVNYGVKTVGSGLVGNSKGFVAGGETTGPEMGRIEEALFP